MNEVFENQSDGNFYEHKYEIKKVKGKTVFKITKRIFDILASFLALPIVLVFVLVFGILIKIEDGGTIFYSQDRVGLDLVEFRIFKLRSMKMNAEKYTGSVWAEKDDPRITKIGKVIRKYRIDEFPQFINVLKGDMSIIGPRPERLDLTLKFSEDVPGFLNRLSVRPGITGLAQVNGGYEITPGEKLFWDKEYIENFSIKLDILIIIKTIKVVLTGDGAR